MTSIYVIVQIVTTVGSGDIPPETETMRLVFACYVLCLVLVGVYAMNVVQGWILEKHADFTRRNMRRRERMNGHENVTKGRIHLKRTATGLFVFSLVIGTIFFRLVEHCSCSYGETWQSADFDHEACPEDTRGITFEQCRDAGGWVKSTIDCFYMSVMTVTTVGFGDYSPVSYWGRVFAIFYMLFGVGSTGFFMTTMAEYLFEDEIKYEGAMDIDKGTFASIDEDGSGEISRSEYSMFVLLRHGIVPPETVEEINQKFDSMDRRHAGSVTWDDLLYCRSHLLDFAEDATTKSARSR